jgi:homoserine dehydrogenase
MNEVMIVLKIALLGFGTVGKSVYNLLLQRFPEFEVKYVLVKNIAVNRGIKAVVTDDFSRILNDEEIECVIEVIGDYEIVFDYLKQAIKYKKHVVTANKAILSRHFLELNSLARESEVKLGYEASVGAAMIIIDPLINLSKVNQIKAIEGVINGSTNYILSRIFRDNLSLVEAKTEALNKGFIESGTNDDLGGYDLMRKINILAMIAYDCEIKENQIARMSLDVLNHELITFLKNNGLEIKYLATAKKLEEILTVHLEPVILNKQHFYNNFSYEQNFVIIEGEYPKQLMFSGVGAGGDETASAIIYDLLKINEKHYFNPKQKVKIDNEREKFNWLIKENGRFKVGEPMSINEMQINKSCLPIRIHPSAISQINKERL